MLHIDTQANNQVQLAENVFHHGSVLPTLFGNDVAVAQTQTVRTGNMVGASELLDTCRCCPVNAASHKRSISRAWLRINAVFVTMHL